jgi:hypothetical protein
MTRNYTAQVDWKLAIRLHEAGFPKEITEPLFSEVFDWMLEKGISIEVSVWHAPIQDRYEYLIDPRGRGLICPDHRFDTWQEAATAAIEKAMEIMEGK